MLAVLSQQAPVDLQNELRARGIAVCLLTPHPFLPPPVAHHPDMLLFVAPDAIFCTKSYAKIATNELAVIAEYTHLPVCPIDRSVDAQYPADILLNAAPIGGRLFCLPRHTAPELTAHPAYRVHPVRQGYAKCSILPVGQNALISEDPSICSAARQAELDVLQVTPGSVRLTGYPHGFLGGAASFSPLAETDEIFVCGDLDRHPDAARIRAFCEQRKKQIIPLGKGPLTDVGTIFLL